MANPPNQKINNLWTESDLKVCSAIPPHTPHAVSVSLPKWQDNIDYEEGKDRVIKNMRSGYPRFCVHEYVVKLNELLLKRLGYPNLSSFTFPTEQIAESCKQFMIQQSRDLDTTQIKASSAIRLAQYPIPSLVGTKLPSTTLYLVIFDPIIYYLGKAFWQHTGEIISSRYAQHCLKSLTNSTTTSPLDLLNLANKKYSGQNIDELDKDLEYHQYLEERFGRNLSIDLVEQAKLAMKKRIVNKAQFDKELIDQKSDKISNINDVFLYPTGMSAIYNAHRLALKCFGELKSVCFGFPYTDTLKILSKFGPGCHFLGHGTDSDIDSLKALLSTSKICSLFCEFPTNPLLRSPNITKLRQLADEHNFLIVVDDTLGQFANINVSKMADITVSSLTKIFSGDSNVMGGSLVISQHSSYQLLLNKTLQSLYEDTVWCEDAIFLERNSRTFEDRVKQINHTTEALCDAIRYHPKVKTIHYPKYIDQDLYSLFQPTITSGYGGLFTIQLTNPNHAPKFYDTLPIAKGPSLGTNFTLACPYTLLAHYTELPWAEQFGVTWDMVRVAVGLEDKEWIISAFLEALDGLVD